MNSGLTLVHSWKSPLSMALTMGMGLLLPACQMAGPGSVSPFEEKDSHPYASARIFTGLVVDLRKDKTTGRSALTIRTILHRRPGRPSCIGSSGPLKVVEAGKTTFLKAKNRLQSAMVVIGPGRLRVLPKLGTGACVLVITRRPGTAEKTLRPGIRILLPSARQKSRIRGRVIVLGLFGPPLAHVKGELRAERHQPRRIPARQREYAAFQQQPGADLRLLIRGSTRKEGPVLRRRESDGV